MKYLVDTDICSYALKGHAPTVLRWRPLPPAATCISVVTEAELRFGAKGRSTVYRRELERFLDALDIVPFSSTETATYADLRYQLARAGTPIGVLDLVIAAQALANDFVLVTNNEREFRRVPGLKIENWVA
ncbi:MAG TPA: type II toxin-antitoxin system VapC family toxin [Kofleriaceae bacterium]